MSKAPIWHVATDALIADTTHLDTLEFGAYTKLMLAQWRNNGNPLPNNPKRLALMMGVTQAQFRRIWPAISDFFEVTETTISQQRIAKDFKNVIEKIEKNKQNGKLGGKAKSLKIKEQGLANASDPPERKSTIPEPEPEPDISNIDKSMSEIWTLELEYDYLAWQAEYPIQGNPDKTRKAFYEALQRIELDELLAHTKAYAVAFKGRPHRFIHKPQNYLGDSVWKEPLPEPEFDPIKYLKELEAQDAN